MANFRDFWINDNLIAMLKHSDSFVKSRKPNTAFDWGTSSSPPEFIRRKVVHDDHKVALPANFHRKIALTFLSGILVAALAKGWIWLSREQLSSEAGLVVKEHVSQTALENKIKNRVVSPKAAHSSLKAIHSAADSLGGGEFRITTSYKVKSGDSLGKIFAEHGLSWVEARETKRALAALAKKSGLNLKIRQGQTLLFHTGQDGNLVNLELKLSAGHFVSIDKARALPNDTGLMNSRVMRADRFIARLHSLPTKAKEHIAAGLIKTTFIDAAREAGLSFTVIDEIVDLFSERIAFHRDFHRGDRFVVIHQEHVLPDGTSIESGPIIAASIYLGKRRLTAIRFVGDDGKPRYFDRHGQLLGTSFLRYPLQFTRISSYFSNARMHPVLKRRMPHHGVDFAAPRGTTVRAVADAKVIFAGRKGANGIMLRLRHNRRYQTAYLHLSRIAKGIKSGTFVKRGQKIGEVGSTGRSTGPHLDYRIFDDKRAVDPLTTKLPIIEELNESTRITKVYLKHALQTLEYYNTQLVNIEKQHMDKV